MVEVSRCYALENIGRTHEGTMKKISKPVLYDGVRFESIRDLAKHLKLPSPNYIYTIIRNGHYKGKKIERLKK